MENELFEKTPIHKAYFTLALPVVFSMIVSLVYNMVDTYFIAQTGDTNLIAGVSLGAPIFTFMVAIGDIFGLGGSSIISRLFGEKRDDDGKRLSAFCFYASIFFGIFITILLIIFKDSVLNILGADTNTYYHASQYYTYIVLGAPANILFFTPTNLLRTEGFAKASMKGSIYGSILNIILDPIFIQVFGMGAAGAAIATVIANLLSDIYYIWFIVKKSRRLSVSLKIAHVNFKELKEILLIGIPASITNIMQTIGVILTNNFLLVYGNDKVASMGIVLKVNMISVLILVGFAFGIQPLIGFNYGAKNFDRLKKALKFSIKFQCTLAAILTAILFLAAPFILRFFVDDVNIIDSGIHMLRWQLISMVFVSIVLIITCTFQATGKAFGAFLLSLSRQGVIFAVVLFIGAKLFGYEGVVTSQAIADLATAVLAVILFFTGLKKEMEA